MTILKLLNMIQSMTVIPAKALEPEDHSDTDSEELSRHFLEEHRPEVGGWL